jgi:hypothetical protein
MSEALIRNALVTAYEDGAFGLETFYQNVKLSHPSKLKQPPSGQPWAYLTQTTADIAPMGLGDQGDDEHKGFMQIDLNYPLDIGEGLILAKFDAIKSYFKAGRSFVSGGQVVIIRSCGRSSGRVVEQNYRISVSVYWFARVSRAS